MAKKKVPVTLPAVVNRNDWSLVPSSTRVKTVAFCLRWRIETLIERVSNALPSPVEQGLYLRVAGGYPVHPDTVRKMLEVFRGSQCLLPQDTVTSQIGENLGVNKFDIIMEKLEQALALIDKDDDRARYTMSAESAAVLVEFYGSEAEDMLGKIVDNLAEVAELLGIRSDSERLIVGVAVGILVERLKDHQIGSPLPLTIEDLFGHPSARKKARYE